MNDLTFTHRRLTLARWHGLCVGWGMLGCASISELQSRLGAHCEAHPGKTWVVGVGWDQSAWGRYPTRQDLDQVREGGAAVEREGGRGVFAGSSDFAWWRTGVAHGHEGQYRLERLVG